MNKREIEAFVDRLKRSGKALDDVAGMAEEERAVAELWQDLGELEGEAEFDEELVSDFKDKLAAYRKGWEEKAAVESRGRSLWWTAGSYVLVAGAAAAMAWAGFVGVSMAERNEVLRAELESTQETLAFSLLEQASAPKRLEGLATVSKISSLSPRLRETVVRTFDSDTNVNVRLAAVAALKALPREEALGILLERMESEGSPLVQLEILRNVLELVGEEGAAEMMKRLEGMEMEPRVKSSLDTSNQRI